MNETNKNKKRFFFFSLKILRAFLFLGKKKENSPRIARIENKWSLVWIVESIRSIGTVVISLFFKKKIVTKKNWNH